MAITTRSEYGLRAMVLLSEQLGDELLSAREIARREHIPLKYLEQILSELKRSGLVISQAGPRGGYRTARPAAQICVAEVVNALDGPVIEAPTNSQSGAVIGPRLSPLWTRLQHAITTVLEGTTLDQLAWGTQLEALPVPASSATSGEPESADSMTATTTFQI